MKELELFWKITAEGLRLLAKGIETVAQQLDAMAQPEKVPDTGEETQSAGKPGERQTAAPKPPKATAVATVLAVIESAPGGIRTKDIAAQTGYDARKIQKIAYKLKKRGKITAPARGVYLKRQ